MINHQNKAIIITSSSTYGSRVDLIEKFLKYRGYSVAVLEPDFDHHNKRKRIEEKENHEYIPMIPYKRNLSCIRLFSLYNFSGKIYKKIEEFQPALLYVLLPANALAAFMTKYKRKHSVYLIYDVIDMWPEALPFRIGKGLWPFSVWRDLRNKNIPVADLCLAECNLFSDKLLDQTGRKIQTLYWPKQIKEPEWKKCNIDNGLHICYLGSINSIIDIKRIAELLEQLNQKVKVYCHIIGTGKSKGQFIEKLEDRKISVIDEGIVYDEEIKENIMSRCQYGLNIMKTEVFVGLTMKSVEYLANGLMLLNTIQGDTWRLVEKEKIGFNCEYPISNQFIEAIISEAKKNIDKKRIRVVYEQFFSERAFENRLSKIWDEHL